MRRGDLGGVEDPGGKVEDRDGAGVEEQGMVVGDQTNLKVESHLKVDPSFPSGLCTAARGLASLSG